jgi:hypothetical protein
MYFRPFQALLVAFALVARSTATNPNSPQRDCHSASSASPLLDQIPEDGLFTSSSPSVWSERLLSLLDPNDGVHPKSRLRAFADDLHLAFAARPHPPPPLHKHGKRHSDSELLRRADSQKVIKCKAQSGLGSSHDHDDSKPTSTTLPGMTPTDSNGRPLPTQTVSEGHGGGGREVIAVTEPCGDIPVGASIDVQATTGPNGQQTWLTCGISVDNKTSGWKPPNATINQIITLEGGLRAAVKMDGSPYKACTDYIEIFEAAGGEFGIPPLFIAAFALQESSCNPTTMGQGGETGMMQISADKCANAPNGNCLDVWYNVRTATSYFANVIKACRGNVFEAVGQYNGWNRGMSYNEATTWGINGNCCRCQRNLDYLQQFFNGWLQGRSAYSSPRLGSFFNTDKCSA